MKRKKQEFHRRKSRAAVETEGETPDPVEKTAAGLQHLGTQNLSESGGYGMANWMENLNLLLDDYEKAAGEKGLTPEYRAARADGAKLLSTPPDTSKLDGEMEQARTEIARILAEARNETKERQAKLAVLREQRAKASMELAGAKRQLEEAKEPRPSGGFLSRIFAKGPPPTAPMEKRVEHLEQKLNEVDAKVQAAESNEAAKERAKALEALEAKLDELGTQREVLTQMAEARQSVTSRISEAVKGAPAAKIEPGE